MHFNTSTQWLELIVAIVYIVSEYKLAQHKVSGWIWEILASGITAIFFLSMGYCLLAVVEALNIPFALYGFLKWKFHVQKGNKIDISASLFAFMVITIYFFCGEAGNFLAMQATASALFIVGTILIARENILGWYACIIADILVGLILLHAGSYIFFSLQIVAVSIGLWKITPPSSERIVFFKALIFILYLGFHRYDGGTIRERPKKLSAIVASY